MAITTTCSGCGKTLAVADQFAGRLARCPACNTTYTVPQPEAAKGPPAEIVAAADWGDPFDKQPIELNPISPAEPIGNAEPITPTPKATPSRPDLATTIGSSAEAAELPDFIDPAEPIELQPVASGNAPPTLTPLAPQAAWNSSSASLTFWMRAPDGNEYGPADSDTLARWFREGRVGPNYTIRQGEHGPWQPALRFAPQQDTYANSTNPFASPASVPTSQLVGYAKSDQSALVLAMGILCWIGFCPVFGLVAWAVGAQSLHDMQAGNSDPTNRSLVQFGYYLGMVNVIIWACCLGFSFLSAIF